MDIPNNFAQDRIDLIQSKIKGRLAYEHHNCNYLAWAIAQAGRGDHLEIGALHGGSAVLAALIKTDAGFDDHIYSVDPLDGYYMGTKHEYPVDYVTNVPVSPEVFGYNIGTFFFTGRIHWIRGKSVPFPEELAYWKFASAYIDGDHEGDTPTLDWQNVSARTHGYVVFDNADAAHPDVLRAVDVAKADPGWECIFHQEITAIFRKR